MWRYQKLLPIRPQSIVSAGEGFTPIIFLEDLSRELKIDLFIKDESQNPTGTFKDREASLVISRSIDLGQNNLVFQSTGNTGLAITYYAGLAGLKSYFFGPKISHYKLYLPCKKSNNKIILIDGTPLEIKNYAENFARINNFPKVSPFSERCEANATLAYEDYEANFWPDYYLQTVAAGMGPIGYFTGHERLVKWGLIEKTKLPKIIAVQISEFDPLYRGWIKGRKELTEQDNLTNYPSSPYEPTLFTTNSPTYYPQFRRIIRKSKGEILAVKPAEVERSEKKLINSLAKKGIELNLEVERSPLIGFAGLCRLIDQGKIPLGSKVLLLITGRKTKGQQKIEPDIIIKPNFPPEKLLEKLEKGKE